MMSRTSKDYWRKKREKEEWFRSVDIKYLFQFQAITKELEQFTKSNPHPITERIVNEYKRIFAGMTEEIVDFNLKKERLPEDVDGIFSNATMGNSQLIK